MVNCVGVVFVEKVVGKEGLYWLESFVKVININFVGIFNMICLVVDVMLKGELDGGGEWGVIINMVLVVVYEG